MSASKSRAKVVVIGGGAAGLAAASTVAHHSQSEVTLLEKNSTVGGRGRSFSERGFLFDMGPSWYWMPDIFESFFAEFGHSTSDFYTLTRLDPAFRMIFSESDVLDVPGTEDGLIAACEKIEPGAGTAAKRFFAEGKLKYDVGVKSLAYKPSQSLCEFIDPQLIFNLHRMHLVSRFDRYVASFFKDPRLKKLMEFPILFLGTLPSTTPAMYSFMNYGGFVGGTWYPQGGMCQIALALEKVATNLGVTIRTNTPVREITVADGKAHSLRTATEEFEVGGIVAAADYHHVDQVLLPSKSRKYSPRYWDTRVLAPSSFILYLGVGRKIDRLLHHNLFFDADFPKHARALTVEPAWPEDPLFYVSCPSKSDPLVAPTGCENLFILVPLAAGLSDTEELRLSTREKVLARLERFTGVKVRDHILYERSFCINDFISEYHALKGNAYGLANTLLQTATGKPQMVSSKVKNLVYAGQLTVPGPGLPPSLISGQIAGKQLLQRA